MSATTLTICAARTHPGKQRENNEDRFYYDLERGIFLVIDGVGGQAAGELAAETALSVLRARLERQTGDLNDRIREAITLANNEVYRLAQESEEWKGMACVLTVAVVEQDQVTIGHVGDTRLYKLWPGGIEKLTHDHSPVGEQEDSGQLSEQEAMHHPRRNEVYRDVGSEEHAPDDEGFIEITSSSFEPESALLLCSDGLSDLVPSADMLNLAKANAGDPWKIVQALIDAANDAGGKDNITVVFVEGHKFAPAWSPSLTTLKTLAGPRIVDKEGEVRDDEKFWPRVIGKAFRYLQMGVMSRWAVAICLVVIGMLLMNIINLGLGWKARMPLVKSFDSDSPKKLLVARDLHTAFATIGEAMLEAKPGDTIEVAPGDYPEQIELKQGVSLISQKSREAVIRPFGKLAEYEAVIIAVNVDDAQITGFRIDGGESGQISRGLLLIDANVKVEDLEISGAGIAGIEITGSGSATLMANFIHDNSGAGVLINGTGAARLAHNLIANNGREPGSSRPGVEIRGSAQPSFTGNVIYGSGAEDIKGLPGDKRRYITRNNLIGIQSNSGKGRGNNGVN
jgi:PPM family protein phosphatase